MRNMRAQLLTFQNGVFIQDSCYSVITRFYQKGSFRNDNKFIIMKSSSKNGKVNKLCLNDNLERLISHFTNIALLL